MLISLELTKLPSWDLVLISYGLFLSLQFCWFIEYKTCKCYDFMKLGKSEWTDWKRKEKTIWFLEYNKDTVWNLVESLPLRKDLPTLIVCRLQKFHQIMKIFPGNFKGPRKLTFDLSFFSEIQIQKHTYTVPHSYFS